VSVVSSMTAIMLLHLEKKKKEIHACDASVGLFWSQNKVFWLYLALPSFVTKTHGGCFTYRT
jgi:hypothetical protein